MDFRYAQGVDLILNPSIGRMGTHQNGPSKLADNESILLASWLEQRPLALGEKVLELFGRDLPFLFKVSNNQRKDPPHARSRPFVDLRQIACAGALSGDSFVNPKPSRQGTSGAAPQKST